MSKKKYKIAYESKLYDASETMEILKNCSPDIFFKLYHKYKKELVHPGVNTVRTSRLDRIEESIANLSKEMRDGFKQVNIRLDRVESRLDHVESRLNYIVKENNLKDSPNR